MSYDQQGQHPYQRLLGHIVDLPEVDAVLLGNADGELVDSIGPIDADVYCTTSFISLERFKETLSILGLGKLKTLNAFGQKKNHCINILNGGFIHTMGPAKRSHYKMSQKVKRILEEERNHRTHQHGAVEGEE